MPPAAGAITEPGVILQAEELYRFYRSGEEETRALRGVTFHAAAGEVVAVCGPSGSGKSTLLACLAGLDDPDGGTVRVDGHRISHRPQAERAALRARLVGVLFQSGTLIEHLTVAANVDLAQRLAERRDPRRRDNLLESLGLSGRAGSWPSRRSGGEAARAGRSARPAAAPRPQPSSPRAFTGTYGEYLLGKVSKVFPQLREDGL